MPSRTPAGLAALNEYLKRKRGFDFTGYQPASIERRVQKRMGAIGVSNYADYVDYLEVHPEEFEILFNTILFNVTAFFRDAAAWEVLARRVIPRMLASKSESGPVRVWSAGCASGEEAYSLAILFAEAMGAKGYRERVKIYATDIDEAALARAREATYDEREIAGVPEQLLARYFEQADGRYAVRKGLRRNVIIGRHDLSQDAPVSRVDLLVCRNTLMYFSAEEQSRLLTRFHFALNDGGVLFLGRADSPRAGANRFAPIHLRSRIAVKVARPKLDLRDRLTHIKERGALAPDESRGAVDRNVRLSESALDSVPMALLVVDARESLVLANERARLLYALSPTDLGRPIHELDLTSRSAEIRSSIEQALAGRLADPLRDVEWHTAGGETKWLDVHVMPLSDSDEAISGVAIAFVDVTVAKRLQRMVVNSNQELEAAYEELKSTHEEQETAGEAFRSMIDELETTNEALRSANQELESMNDELRSANAELQTINGELRQRGEELSALNALLESILTGLPGGVAVVDRKLDVLVWNHRARDLWGLRADEAVGRNLLNLEIGLPVERLEQPVRDCLSGRRDFVEIRLDATTRNGRALESRVTCSPLLDGEHRVAGVIVMMEDLDATQLSESRRGDRVRREAELRS